MNICCGDDLRVERPKYSDVEVKVEEGILTFDNDLGVFNRNIENLKRLC